jgi:hypothetical protein
MYELPHYIPEMTSIHPSDNLSGRENGFDKLKSMREILRNNQKTAGSKDNPFVYKISYQGIIKSIKQSLDESIVATEGSEPLRGLDLLNANIKMLNNFEELLKNTVFIPGKVNRKQMRLAKKKSYESSTISKDMSSIDLLRYSVLTKMY